MRKIGTYFLLSLLISAFTCLLSLQGFSQSNPKESETGDSSYVKGITTGRAKSIAIGLIGLGSLIIGWRAKARSGGNSSTGGIVAVSLGVTGIILSIVHLGTSAGAVFGSGSGKAGAIVAIVLSFVGLILGGLSIRKKI